MLCFRRGRPTPELSIPPSHAGINRHWPSSLCQPQPRLCLAASASRGRAVLFHAFMSPVMPPSSPPNSQHAIVQPQCNPSSLDHGKQFTRASKCIHPVRSPCRRQHRQMCIPSPVVLPLPESMPLILPLVLCKLTLHVSDLLPRAHVPALHHCYSLTYGQSLRPIIRAPHDCLMSGEGFRRGRKSVQVKVHICAISAKFVSQVSEPPSADLLTLPWKSASGHRQSTVRTAD